MFEDDYHKPIVAVVGGGPAGLMAAGTAAACGARVMLFEKKRQCGRKLLLTGSGQCNITNSASFSEFLHQYPENRKFLYPALRSFFVGELIRFFQEYELELSLDDNGKYFPADRRARSVLEVLLAFCRAYNVTFQLNEPVLSIEKNDDFWLLRTGKATYKADRVILATGGLSYPGTGSDGDGLCFAADLAHSIVTPRPGLVALDIAKPYCGVLSGISLRDVNVSLKVCHDGISGRQIAKQSGDLLFTHFGVSGPAVLFLSRWLPADYEYQPESTCYVLDIDLLPAISLDDLEKSLLNLFAVAPRRQLKTVLSGEFLIPNALVVFIIKECGFPEDKLCHEMTKAERQKLLIGLKSFILTIGRSRGFKEAMVTAGGVATREINPRTMESKLHPGLYFAGEIIDIDGYTGGFNLQAAFSTGYLAGTFAARK